MYFLGLKAARGRVHANSLVDDNYANKLKYSWTTRSAFDISIITRLTSPKKWCIAFHGFRQA